MVISSAIDKYVFVIISERFDDKIYINYSKKEIVDTVSEISHELVREAMKMVGVEKGIEITMLADIPSSGSGLGSSSSITVGLLNALYNFKGELVTAERLAVQACQIEIDILKKPIGKQDQYIAAFGGIKKLIFNSNDPVEVIDINLTPEQRRNISAKLMLHFTNITRNADDILVEQNANADKNFQFLSSLADLVPQFENELAKGNIDSLAQFLKTNWELKKQLAKSISKPEIEEMIDIAEKNGAIGYKIAGAGGGGFLLSFVQQEKQELFKNKMASYRELPFMLEPFGSRIIFNYTRYNSKNY
jgi:D-glycero-alpha-D-manno-heptose-7-phosphate kinase